MVTAFTFFGQSDQMRCQIVWNEMVFKMLTTIFPIRHIICELWKWHIIGINCNFHFREICIMQARRQGAVAPPPPPPPMIFFFFFLLVSSAASHVHDDNTPTPLWIFWGNFWGRKKSVFPPPTPNPPPPGSATFFRAGAAVPRQFAPPP